MKIAFLNLYSGSVNRGAETFVYELAQRLSVNHKVTVFQGGDASGTEKYKVVKVFLEVNWKRGNKSNSIARKIFMDYWSRRVLWFTILSLKEVWRDKYDIVIPLNGGWQPAMVRIITWLYGGKMTISGQSGIGWDDINNLWCLPNAFVVLSSLALKWAIRVNPFTKVKYIPNGVDIKKFSPSGNKLKVSLKQPVVVCVGALTRAKRIDLAIKAVAKLKGVNLLVVGDGELKEEITKLGNKHLPGRFELVSLPFSKMPEVYRSARVFTLVSEPYQSFEIVIVEAMAANIPVVTNDDPIRREIVDGAGILVDPTNVDYYARAISEALSRSWGDIPRKRSKEFSWDEISTRYEKLFNDL